jgi:tetratricopeptide (TPR) repeat protein
MSKYWLLALLAISTSGWAVQPFAPTPAEEVMCQARVYSRLGPRDQNTMHMHHYCSGLRMLSRAHANIGNKSVLRYNVGRAISNFDYVLQHTDKSYYMRGEVHVNKGLALKLAGRKADALAEFNRAVEYDIASPEAYLALADHYTEIGNKTKALEMATAGLKRSPDSRGLKRRYTELGGKLPYPARVEPAETETTQVPEVEVDVVRQPAAYPEQSAANPQVPLAEVKEPTPEPKIGSPTNPHCRFCPD